MCKITKQDLAYYVIIRNTEKRFNRIIGWHPITDKRLRWYSDWVRQRCYDFGVDILEYDLGVKYGRLRVPFRISNYRGRVLLRFMVGSSSYVRIIFNFRYSRYKRVGDLLRIDW